MTTLTESAGRVIAGDMTTVFHAADRTLLDSARLAISVLEGTDGSGMPPLTKQKLLESMSAGVSKFVEGRREMVRAHSQMVVIQRSSNIAEVDYGCLGGPSKKFFTSAEDAQEHGPIAQHA